MVDLWAPDLMYIFITMCVIITWCTCLIIYIYLAGESPLPTVSLERTPACCSGSGGSRWDVETFLGAKTLTNDPPKKKRRKRDKSFHFRPRPLRADASVAGLLFSRRRRRVAERKCDFYCGQINNNEPRRTIWRPLLSRARYNNINDTPHTLAFYTLIILPSCAQGVSWRSFRNPARTSRLKRSSLSIRGRAKNQRSLTVVCKSRSLPQPMATWSIGCAHDVIHPVRDYPKVTLLWCGSVVSLIVYIVESVSGLMGLPSSLSKNTFHTFIITWPSVFTPHRMLRGGWTS